MTKTNSARESIAEVLQDLAAVRDQARLQAHLFSLQAKARLSRLETNFHGLEQKMREGGGPLEAAVEGVREVTEAIRELVAEYPAHSLATPVCEMMSRGVRTCSEHDSLWAAAKVLWEGDCGAVPVVGFENRLIGIITDRDICMAAYTQGGALSDLKVSRAMTRDVVSIAPSQTAQTATEVMQRRRVRRLPVVEANGTLVGMLSLADLLRVKDPSPTWLAETLGEICERPRGV
jgi:CBS domain-containing protein